MSGKRRRTFARNRWQSTENLAKVDLATTTTWLRVRPELPGPYEEIIMGMFTGPESDIFDSADDVFGLTLDELRDLPYQTQIGLDLSAADD